ncbi:MAG: hypothetical protein GY856_11300 [bacterium]|nr:hypothetical protein [bacterium]
MLAMLGLVGCGEPDPEVAREELEQALRAYLPKLGEAYATRNPEVLAGVAVEKEQFRVRRRIEELTAQGMAYEPEFKDLTIEWSTVWSHSNAAVTTLEVWDVRSYSLGSHILLSEVLAQRNRVKYQLKRKETGWVILYRDLQKALE